MSVPCGSCQAPILWIKTPKGKSMPLDATPRPDGNVVIRDGLAVVLTAIEKAQPLDGQRRFLAHWISCPNAASHRKAKT